MVLMAQPFSYRYPIVDGQGNWGSQDDPKSFAAMRYTESKLTRYAEVLLTELAHGTVDWQPNFDGTLEEPTLLPARLPNLLLNGTTGIAVGMATDIPPHNLREVANACIHLLEEPGGDDGQLDEARQGARPADRRRDHLAARGPQGVLREGRRQLQGARDLRDRRRQRRHHRLPVPGFAATACRSRSPSRCARRSCRWSRTSATSRTTRIPSRLVIIPRSNRVDMVEVMNHLFATTDLERNYRVNLNIIALDGRPKVMGLKDLLSEWLEFRITTVTRRLQHRLDKVDARLHILEGLLIAYLNLDEVIRIIRREDEPKPVLMKRFKLSEEQTEAILETQAAPPREARGDEDPRGAEGARARSARSSRRCSRARRSCEARRRGNPRGRGEVRRRPPHEDRRARGRAGDRRDLADPERAGDGGAVDGRLRALGEGPRDRSAHAVVQDRRRVPAAWRAAAACSRRCSSTARAAPTRLPAHSLPSARGQGEPLSGRLNPPDGAKFAGVIMGEPEDLWLFASDAGYGFTVRLKELITDRRAGKTVLNVPDNSLGAAAGASFPRQTRSWSR